jgi:hypothetical protein
MQAGIRIIYPSLHVALLYKYTSDLFAYGNFSKQGTQAGHIISEIERSEQGKLSFDNSIFVETGRIAQKELACS